MTKYDTAFDFKPNIYLHVWVLIVTKELRHTGETINRSSLLLVIL